MSEHAPVRAGILVTGTEVLTGIISDRNGPWLSERLREAGFPDPLADSVARDSRYDLHQLLGLIDRGCPAELAARILAPLDGDQRPC